MVLFKISVTRQSGCRVGDAQPEWGLRSSLDFHSLADSAFDAEKRRRTREAGSRPL
jgi:hypothetical protein